MSFAILFPAVCVWDIVNKANMSWTRVYHTMDQPFSALHW